MLLFKKYMQSEIRSKEPSTPMFPISHYSNLHYLSHLLQVSCRFLSSKINESHCVGA